MWWTMAAAAEPEPGELACVGSSETHLVEAAWAHGATEAEAREAADADARAKLLERWCGPDPGSWWCREAGAVAQSTRSEARRDGGRWSACATVMIHEDHVERLESQTAELRRGVATLAESVAGKAPARLAILWTQPVPADLPRDWLQQSIEVELAARRVPVANEVKDKGMAKLDLRATDDPDSGGFAVTGCLGVVGSTECDTLAQRLLLPVTRPVADGPPVPTARSSARPALWAGFAVGAAASAATLAAGGWTESRLASSGGTREEVESGAATANALYGVGYGALAVTGGLGLALVVGGGR